MGYACWYLADTIKTLDHVRDVRMRTLEGVHHFVSSGSRSTCITFVLTHPHIKIEAPLGHARKDRRPSRRKYLKVF